MSGVTVHDLSPILLVEDDGVDVEFFRRALKKTGVYNPLYIAEDGVTALDMLLGIGGRERLDQPALLVIDINMPRMNGLELLSKIRGDASIGCSVVFILTTSGRKEDKEGALNLKAAGYFLKENADILVQKMKGLLEGQKLQSLDSQRC